MAATGRTKLLTTQDVQPTPQHKLAFRFNSGRLSLDLVCTERHRPSQNVELLANPSDLARRLVTRRYVSVKIDVGRTGVVVARNGLSISHGVVGVIAFVRHGTHAE